MKLIIKLLTLIISISLLLGCYKTRDDRNETVNSNSEIKEDYSLSTNVQGNKQMRMPTLLLDNSQTAIRDLTIKEDYCMIPLWKTLSALGAELISDSKYNTYTSLCFKYIDKLYIIDWTNQLLISAEVMSEIEEKNTDYNQSLNNAKNNGLIPSVSEGKGENAIIWEAKEVYIGNNVFVQLMENFGLEVSLIWDYHNQTINMVSRRFS